MIVSEPTPITSACVNISARYIGRRNRRLAARATNRLVSCTSSRERMAMFISRLSETGAGACKLHACRAAHRSRKGAAQATAARTPRCENSGAPKIQTATDMNERVMMRKNGRVRQETVVSGQWSVVSCELKLITLTTDHRPLTTASWLWRAWRAVELPSLLSAFVPDFGRCGVAAILVQRIG